MSKISPTDHGYPLHIYVIDPNPSSTDPSIAKLSITLKGIYETVDRENPRETIEVAHNVSITLDRYTYVNESYGSVLQRLRATSKAS